MAPKGNTNASKPLAERFGAKYSVDQATGCWLWMASLDSRNRYGQLWTEGTMGLAHVVSHTLFKGPVPDGREVDHTCRTPRCVNPAHLEAVTPTENMRRARRTHCKRGHVMDDGNTVKNGRGRKCKTCQRARALAWYHQRKR